MKRVLLVVLIFCATAWAAKGGVYQNGKLIDLRSYSTEAGAARAQSEYCMAVSSEDISYLLQYEPRWRWNYNPASLIVGDNLGIRIKGNTMFIQKADGEVKMKITRRQRISEGNPPMTCSLPVTTN